MLETIPGNDVGPAEVTPCVIYAAKSTADPRGSIDTQLADCRSMAQRHGWEVKAEHTDEAKSAYTSSRGAGLVSACADAEALAHRHGQCTLVVQHTDRLARGDGVLARHLVEVLLWARKAHVRIRSVQDDDSGASILNAAMMGERNHTDSARKALAVADGLRRAAERGDWAGGVLADGYALRFRQDATGRQIGRDVTFDPQRKHIYVAMWDMAREGYSVESIELEFSRRGFRTSPRRKDRLAGPFDRNSINQRLDNPFYAGLMVHRREVIGQGNWPSYVGPEDFYRLREERRSRCHYTKRTAGRPRAGFLLLNLVACGECGRRLDAVTGRPRTDGTSPRRYVCRGHREHHRDSVQWCPAGPFDAATVDPTVLSNLDSLLGEVGRWREQLLGGHRAERERLTMEVERAQENMTNHTRGAQRLSRRLSTAVAADDESGAEILLELVKAERKRSEGAETVMNAALDALSAMADEPQEDEAQKVAERLHAALSGRLAGADDDLRQTNMLLREWFQEFSLSHDAGGAVRVVPILSEAAVARVMREPDRWPHGVRVTASWPYPTVAVNESTFVVSVPEDELAQARSDILTGEATIEVTGPPALVADGNPQPAW